MALSHSASRSLYDCLQAHQPKCEEKRTLIDLLSIKETVGANHVLWVPSPLMLADGLTKVDDSPMQQLLQTWQDTQVKLSDGSTSINKE